MKRLLLAASFAFALAVAVPSVVNADGCNATSCTTSGTYWEWYWYPPGFYGCNWVYTQWDNGSWYYADCHGSDSRLYL